MFDKNKDYGVDDEISAIGNEFMSFLADASIQHSVNGLGGCKDFDINNFPEEYRTLIQAYINKDIDSITACYIVMKSKDINR